MKAGPSPKILLAQNEATAPRITAQVPNRAPAQSPPTELPPKLPPGAPAAPEAQATPAPVDASWTCQTSAMNERGEPTGSPPEGLTVGDKFLLSCEGPAVPLDAQKLTLELPKEVKYTLRLLETREFTDSRAQFVATSWTAGEIKLPQPVLTDGAKRIGLSPFEIKVNTVIDPQKNPEMKPAPPWGPAALSWPPWVWGAIVLAVVLVLALLALSLRRTLRRKRLLKLLEKNPIAMSPYHQFNKDLRKLSRQIPLPPSDWGTEEEKAFFKELDQSLRWFIARELVVPVFGRKPREILVDLRRRDRKLHDHLKRDFAVTLTELDKAITSKARVSPDDAQQVIELCRVLIDRIRQERGAVKA